jgi:membrane associated rhomboid family serine protease
LVSLTTFLIIITSLASIAAFSNHKLMNDWILNPYAIKHDRQWWRMFTGGLLHGNWMHLIVNMLVLYMFGGPLERYFKDSMGSMGSVYFLALYLLGIIIANISTVIKHKDNPSYNALGASGATSALVFAFVALEPWDKTIGFFFIPPGILPNIVFGALYLVYSAYMAKRVGDNIGHEAHFYGALWGVLFMFVSQPFLIENFLRFGR